MKRLRTQGLIKKIANRYKYYFTKLGQRVLVTVLAIREYFLQSTPWFATRYELFACSFKISAVRD